mmetsp:Transcript_15702/g.38726  ORF Transcript_15702/g.38726 Transcript_15702/m.38726 type:complete len:298 (+) Transcript_15702:938-1831(+)
MVSHPVDVLSDGGLLSVVQDSVELIITCHDHHPRVLAFHHRAEVPLDELGQVRRGVEHALPAVPRRITGRLVLGRQPPQRHPVRLVGLDELEDVPGVRVPVGVVRAQSALLEGGRVASVGPVLLVWGALAALQPQRGGPDRRVDPQAPPPGGHLLLGELDQVELVVRGPASISSSVSAVPVVPQRERGEREVRLSLLDEAVAPPREVAAADVDAADRVPQPALAEVAGEEPIPHVGRGQVEEYQPGRGVRERPAEPGDALQPSARVELHDVPLCSRAGIRPGEAGERPLEALPRLGG